MRLSVGRIVHVRVYGLEATVRAIGCRPAIVVRSADQVRFDGIGFMVPYEDRPDLAVALNNIPPESERSLVDSGWFWHSYEDCRWTNETTEMEMGPYSDPKFEPRRDQQR